MNQSSIISVILLLVTQIGFSQNPRLEKLQKTYASEITRVSKPVKNQYGAALQKLQQKYVEANQLEEALLVKKEIESLTHIGF